MGGVFSQPLVLKDLLTIGQLGTVLTRDFTTYTSTGTKTETIYTVPTGKMLIITNFLCMKSAGTATYLYQFVDKPAGTRTFDINIVGNPADYQALSTQTPIYIPSGQVVRAETIVTAQPLTFYRSIQGILLDYSG